MQPRDWKMRIEDILNAISRIQEYTQNMTLDTFATDDRTVDAVIRNITVMGEAAANVPPEVMQKYPDVPWKIMRDFRNVVVHAYFGVKIPILWNTVQNDLPPLVPLLRKILANAD